MKKLNFFCIVLYTILTAFSIFLVFNKANGLFDWFFLITFLAIDIFHFLARSILVDKVYKNFLYTSIVLLFFVVGLLVMLLRVGQDPIGGLVLIPAAIFVCFIQLLVIYNGVVLVNQRNTQSIIG